MVKSIDLRTKVKEFEKTYNINYYELMQRFMFERILERISVSSYQNNFILKGGLFLSAVFGVANRTTRDMDTTVTGIDISKEKMIKVLSDILTIDLNDGVEFDIADIKNIRMEDIYGGNKYRIIGKINNIKISLEIDISTGDRITPRALKYKYELLFEDRAIYINSYNLETILSEKIETVLRRGKFNSRMKDFYDIYFLLTKMKAEIDAEILKEAIKNTFDKRNSFDYLNDYDEIIEIIKSSDRIRHLWQPYNNKNKYVSDINIVQILMALKSFLDGLIKKAA